LPVPGAKQANSAQAAQAVKRTIKLNDSKGKPFGFKDVGTNSASSQVEMQ